MYVLYLATYSVLLKTPLALNLDSINLLSGKGVNNFAQLLDKLVTGLSAMISTFAVLSLIYGGILYVTAHGETEQLGKAKQFIVLPIIGLVIVATAYIIVKAVVGMLY